MSPADRAEFPSDAASEALLRWLEGSSEETAMTPDELRQRLDRAAASRDLVSDLEALVADLSAAGPPTLDSVDVILTLWSNTAIST
jgi:hypothetical protein